MSVPSQRRRQREGERAVREGGRKNVQENNFEQNKKIKINILYYIYIFKYKEKPRESAVVAVLYVYSIQHVYYTLG